MLQSPSFNHLALDFCVIKDSKTFEAFHNSCWREFLSLSSWSDRIRWEARFSTSFSFCWMLRIFLALIFPSTLLHCFIAALKFFSLFLRTIPLPPLPNPPMRRSHPNHLRHLQQWQELALLQRSSTPPQGCLSPRPPSSTCACARPGTTSPTESAMWPSCRTRDPKNFGGGRSTWCGEGPSRTWSGSVGRVYRGLLLSEGCYRVRGVVQNENHIAPYPNRVRKG